MREKINKFGYNLLKPFIGLLISGSTRTRALIIHEDEVLLVRGWFGSQSWSMPGGGVKRGEKPKKALKRELREELDLKVHQKHYRQLFKTKQEDSNVNFDVIVYRVDLADKQQFKILKSEIIEADWHKLKKLPDDLHPLVNEALEIAKI